MRASRCVGAPAICYSMVRQASGLQPGRASEHGELFHFRQERVAVGARGIA